MERGSLLNVGLGGLSMVLGLAGLGGALATVFWGGNEPVEAAAAAGPGTSGWRVLEPVVYENLSVFPVVGGPGADTRGFMTLDEALASGEAVVSEQSGDMIRRTRDGRPVAYPQSGGASVNRLVLINRSKRPLVLLAGEVVSGGKQDRVIAKDRIVAPDAEPLPLDVFCVEQGRWSSGSQFASAKLMAHPSVREKVAVEQKQTEVWAAVRSGTTAARTAEPSAAPPRIAAADLNATVAASGTGAYAKIYEQSRVGQSVTAFAEEMEKKFRRATKGQQVVGVAVAYGGEVAWSDLFASGQLFDRYWPKLVRSYAVEALARAQSKENATVADAREFLEPLKGRENVESEPGVYRWRQVTEGRYAEIELEALQPKEMKLHRMKVHRTS